MFLKKRLSWSDGQKACKEAGGTLAMFKTKNSMTDLVNWSMKNEIRFGWVGLLKEHTSASTMKWADGSNLGDVAISKKRVKKEHDKLKTTCFVMKFRGKRFRLRHIRCTVRLPSICEKNVNATQQNATLN